MSTDCSPTEILAGRRISIRIDETTLMFSPSSLQDAAHRWHSHPYVPNVPDVKQHPGLKLSSISWDQTGMSES